MSVAPLSSCGKVTSFSFSTLYHLDQRCYVQLLLGNGESQFSCLRVKKLHQLFKKQEMMPLLQAFMRVDVQQCTNPVAYEEKNLYSLIMFVSQIHGCSVGAVIPVFHNFMLV